MSTRIPQSSSGPRRRKLILPDEPAVGQGFLETPPATMKRRIQEGVMVTVGEFCNRRVVTIAKTNTVLEAAQRMRAHHVGSLVITDESDRKVVPVGIVTDRDIVVSVVATVSSFLESLKVGDMTRTTLITARENESLATALGRMRAEGIRRMPVVNEEGALVGIITFDDLLEFLSDELSELAALVPREQRQEVRRRA